jgi:predicted secreted protein
VTWFTGIVLYVLIWWTVLFAVLPFGARPRPEPDEVTGWRGAPAAPRLGRVVVATTLVSALVFGAAYLLIESDWISFRHGFFALQRD